ncbi:MAG: hypothetical protein HGA36_00895 [Candidatus Moranbacteria bacterium]|nr:hypothetical protein [Candidatus Moranbacteria bacterium]
MGKEIVENVIALKIKDLKKKGFLVGIKSGSLSWEIGFETQKIGIISFISDSSSFIRLIYTQTDQHGVTKKLDYEISLSKSYCNYGGYRYWFLCSCGKKFGVLYSGGDRFACRHCHEFTYKSRNINRYYELYPLIISNKLLKRMDELQSEIRTPRYKGKPTKKQQRLEKIYRQLAYINRLL